MSSNPRSTPEPAEPVLLFRTLILLGLRLRALMDRRLSAIGLTTQQAAVLTIMETRASPPKLGEVAAMLGSSHQNARQLVDALKKKGLLREQLDPDDGRAVRLVATPAVRQLFSSRNEDDHATVSRWLGGLDAEEMRAVLASLRRLYDGLPSEDEPPARPPARRRPRAR